MARVRDFVAVPVLACAFVTVLAVRAREPDAKFEAHQRVATRPVDAKAVEAAVRVVPERLNGPRAKSAVCKALGAGQLGNPWRCVLHYADRDIPNTVHISGDQHWIAVSAGATVDGCCVRLGTTD